MSYTKRIETLQEGLKVLEKQITEATEPATIETLKNKKYTFESELRRLIRLQWEEDTERVHFDDDR